VEIHRDHRRCDRRSLGAKQDTGKVVAQAATLATT
jgi:hypothetical protein